MKNAGSLMDIPYISVFFTLKNAGNRNNKKLVSQ